jgi:uncharacterized membrane protein YeaQ/YmgE (transglycosylase-associated protein family)
MNLLAVLVIGGVVGWLAAQVGGRNEGIIASILIGIVGSFIGSLISTMFTGGDHSYLAFSWVGVVWSFIGALILVFILNAIQRSSAHRHM